MKHAAKADAGAKTARHSRDRYDLFQKELMEEADRAGAAHASECKLRSKVKLHGIVKAVVLPASGSVKTFVAVVNDGSSEIELRFLGRASVPGIVPGKEIDIEGLLQLVKGKLSIFNPSYTLAHAL